MVVHKKKLAVITSFTVAGLLTANPVYANPAEDLSEEAQEQTSQASLEVKLGSENSGLSVKTPIVSIQTGEDEDEGPEDPGGNPGPEPNPEDPGDNPGPDPEPGDPGDNDGGDNPGGGNPGGDNPGGGTPGGGNPGGENPGGGNPGDDNKGPDGDDGGISQPKPTNPVTAPDSPESVNTLPHAKDQQKLASKDGAKQSDQEEGGKLPKTSVSHPTQMAGGLLMSLLGAALLFIRRFRSNGA
ncbi:LPXTG cell wall anchor domain-containing protein [Kroppenstedtia eburnea]|uniref:LPXTG cell wall anchor domain-containing protein n=1 Tax=Kroppenstedtia eburnea TaxID=714067 RepID=UPI00363651DE